MSIELRPLCLHNGGGFSITASEGDPPGEALSSAQNRSARYL